MKPSQQTDQSVDIIIVGGGIVGLSLANALANTDFTVAVVEQAAAMPVPENDQTDLRVSAINPRAVAFFKSAGVWPHLQQRFCAYEKMFVWDTTGLGQIQFDSAELGLAELGCIIENSVLVQALWENLHQAENIHCYHPAEIIAMTPVIDDSGIEGSVNNGSHNGGSSIPVRYAVRLHDDNAAATLTLSTRLLVGADGARSSVRKVAGFKPVRHSYQQQGLVCAVTTQYPHQQTAWQCFMPSGPLAFLPLFNHQSSIVWSLDDAEAQAMLALDDSAFKQALAQASEYKLGDILAVSERKLFPLGHGHVKDYVKPGLALIGDAAHTIHPLAGQGANLGIADALCLAEVITQAKAAGRQWNALHTLLKYQRQRKLDNRLMENAMTGFKILFGQNNPVLAEVRNTGLNLVDHLPIIKNRFIQQALGV